MGKQGRELEGQESARLQRQEEGSWFWPQKDMETAWEAEQTMSLQVSYLCGGKEVGASVG